MSDTIILVLAIGAVLVSAYVAVHVFWLLRRIRRDSKKSFETAAQLEQDWEAFSGKELQARRQLQERVEQLENDIRERVAKTEQTATTTRDRLLQLESYLKEFFEVELKAVFDSFDKTVASVLGEMKSELVRGVERIEEIQAVVDSKSYAQDRIMDGEGSVYRLISEADQGQSGPSGAPEEEDMQILEAPDEPAVDDSEDEGLKLEPEEPK